MYKVHVVYENQNWNQPFIYPVPTLNGALKLFKLFMKDSKKVEGLRVVGFFIYEDDVLAYYARFTHKGNGILNPS